ncbi:hypothetical protein C2G38_2227478 [Gigaspora rosea]|uniref:histidine--tRNA ligase n=1 Tax=Gigaspora rosea TaxID=44941 RepID=A0A397TYV3_9GLOM|nr:hypothetical protein C2G38_2227478 [Gigaspora rosea]
METDASITGEDGSAKSKSKFTLKNSKGRTSSNLDVLGTRDYNEKEMAIREKVFSTIVSVFKKHGAVLLAIREKSSLQLSLSLRNTVLSLLILLFLKLKEILSGKYGEDSKLIYDLNDQGGEKCSLRYDLTVPFARFLAMNGSQYQNIKRYQIAKVYRRDQPAMTKGRMREFYQCDFDIAGVYDPMIADSEVVKIIWNFPNTVCGVPDASIRPIFSAVDKLDKLPWENVKKEMTEEKGLDPNIADRIGNKELLDKLFLDQSLISNNNTKTGLNDMVLLFKYLEIFGALDKISFDLSLARGLDYYTGIIYEAVAEQSGPPKSKDGNQIVRKTKKDSDELDETTVGVGSIAAGGCYDYLVGMFASNKKGNIPCVGVSIVLQKVALEQVKANEVEVYVMAVADGLLEDRMKICSELWDAEIKAEFMYKNKPKLQPQFSVCDR